MLRERDGDDSLSLPGTPFADETLGPEQEPWVELLRTGRHAVATGRAAAVLVPDRAGGGVPLLEAADGWLADAAPRRGPRRTQETCDGAADAWTRSLAAEPTRVGLAQPGGPGQADGDLALAVRRYQAALALRTDLAPLPA